MNTFAPVPRRLGAVTGLESDHAPIAFAVDGLKVLAYNLSNEAAHRWFSEDDNAYRETDLVGIPIGKVARQLRDVAATIAAGTYDVALLQEADPVSVAAFSDPAVTVFSDLEKPNSPFHGKDWVLSIVMMSARLQFTGVHIGGKYLEGGRECRSMLPAVWIQRPDTEPLMLVSTHIRGTDSQYPVEGIKSALALMPKGRVVLAGDFNTMPYCVRNTAPAARSWVVTAPEYATHMCRLNGQYCVAAYDMVVSSGVEVAMLPLPEFPAATALVEALRAAKNSE